MTHGTVYVALVTTGLDVNEPDVTVVGVYRHEEDAVKALLLNLEDDDVIGSQFNDSRRDEYEAMKALIHTDSDMWPCNSELCTLFYNPDAGCTWEIQSVDIS